MGDLNLTYWIDCFWCVDDWREFKNDRVVINLS